MYLLAKITSQHRFSYHGPAQVFSDLRHSKRLRKLSRRRWFETPSRSLWHCTGLLTINMSTWILQRLHEVDVGRWPLRVVCSPVSCRAIPWWRHQMETFSALLALCAGNSPVTDEFPSQRPVVRSFDVFFDLRLNKRLSKQSRRRRFEMPSSSLWRHCKALCNVTISKLSSIVLYGFIPFTYFDITEHKFAIKLVAGFLTNHRGRSYWQEHPDLLPRLAGLWSRFGGVCSLTYCNGNFRVTMISEPFNVIL